MAAGRGMRESVPPKRYADEIFTLKLFPHRKTKAKDDRELYPVVVREVDKIGKRLKIHFVRFSEFRMELVHGELYREIKRKLYSGQKDDPSTRVEVRIDQDVLI